MPHIPQLLKKAEVLARLSCSKSTLYVLMSQEGFPPPIKLGRRDNRWLEGEVTAWLEGKANGRGGDSNGIPN